MKLKLPLLFAAFAGLLAAVCGSYEPVYFASEVKPPALVTGTNRAPDYLPKADEQQIQLAVYSYLLGRDLTEGGQYSALFIQADDDVVDALIKKFPAHVPPIKPSYHIDLRSSQSPLDKDTGKPVMILGADIGEANPDGSMDVIGRWYAGVAVKGFYKISLVKQGGEWRMVGAK
jgi:hypothetical protein